MFRILTILTGVQWMMFNGIFLPIKQAEHIPSEGFALAASCV